ncbi:MAG: class I SAM-dependent methyltransferase [Candidatus Thiodiazotropha sp.]
MGLSTGELISKAKGLYCRFFFESMRGLDTTLVVNLSDVNEEDEERSNYIPSGWATLKRLTDVRPLTSDDVFLDIGSGKGRVVILTATYPVKRVIGVELSSVLHEIAQQNVSRVENYLACQDVQLVCSDATQFQIPDDVTVIYLFNPFVGEPFLRVIDNIGESLDRRKRAIWIFYTNPVMHDSVIKRDWIKVREYKSGSVAIYECSR